jgi:chromosome segregation ATPase
MTETDFDAKLSKLMGIDSQIDELKARLKELNAEYDELNYEITQHMLTTECKGKKVFGKNFILASRTFAKVEDPVKYSEWIERTKSYLLVLQNSPSKLNALCKESLANGTAIPDGVTPGYIQNYVQIRQA